MNSETSTARKILAPYCSGNGLDLGAGGDGITKTAICVDREESSGARAHVGVSPTHLVGDVADLRWFKDDVLDYVYSSHTLEDFDNTAEILKEWVRVIRPGGNLVLFLPDQPTYAAACAAAGSLPNQAHKHAEFSLGFVRERLPSNTVEVTSIWPFPGNSYSFALVARKL